MYCISCPPNYGNKFGLVLGCEELGMAGTEIAEIIGLTQPAVSKAVQHGEKFASDYKLSLADEKRLLSSDDSPHWPYCR